MTVQRCNLHDIKHEGICPDCLSDAEMRVRDKSTKNVPDELRNIRIGNNSDGQKASEDGLFVINVTSHYENPSATVQLPLITGAISAEKLNLIASIIKAAVDNKQKVFVHCTAGLERSPLCVVWYLHKYHEMSFNTAYAQVRLIRPEAWDRRSWITYNSPEEFLSNNRS